MVGSPIFSQQTTTQNSYFQVTYSSSFNTTSSGNVHVIVHNGAGQNVTTSTAGLTILSGSKAVANLTMTGLKIGNYFATFFATSLDGNKSISETTTTSFTVTSSCTTYSNSVTCTIVSNSTTEYECAFITKGGLLFFHILRDSGTPLQGQSISVSYISSSCPGMTVFTTTQQPLITNATGWAVYNMHVVGNYSYQINKLDFNTVLKENSSTFITVKIPSYNITTVFGPASTTTTTSSSNASSTIPEFPNSVFLSLILLFCLVAASVVARGRGKKKKDSFTLT